MMKLGRILNFRANISEKFANVKNTTLDVTGLNASMSRAGISTAGQNVVSSDRIYADFNVYKGKAALSARPVLPSFVNTNSGGLAIKRQGIIMLSFTPSLGERKYDWEKKQVFALSPTEVGSLISLASNSSCEFFHDPAMKTSTAGQVRKSLSVKPHADGSGYFISLTVADNVKKTNDRFTVPVTTAEFAVMRTSFSFALPYIMGWDRYASQMPRLDDNFAKGAPQPPAAPRLKSEWDR